MNKLTDKQKLFCDEYLINGFNATKAAIKAGYSERSALNQGSRMMKNEEIDDMIKEEVINDELWVTVSNDKYEVYNRIDISKDAFKERRIDLIKDLKAQLKKITTNLCKMNCISL